MQGTLVKHGHKRGAVAVLTSIEFEEIDPETSPLDLDDNGCPDPARYSSSIEYPGSSNDEYVNYCRSMT